MRLRPIWPKWVRMERIEPDPEPLHPLENPILQGYLLPDSHGTYWRYMLELFIAAGMLGSWLLPIFGLCVMIPVVVLVVQNGKVISTDRDCYGGGSAPVVCSATSYFDYYFWNITNPAEFMAGVEPPAFQELGPYTFLVSEYRFNVVFNEDDSLVKYTFLNYQDFVPEQSCTGCSLENDNLITINRVYQAFLASSEVQYNDALAFIPSVPLAMRQIVAGIVGGLEAAGVPASYAPTAAISQWGRAAYGFPEQLTGHEDPTNPEFANWAHVYAGLDFATAGALLTDAQAGVLLTLLQGNPSFDQPGDVDGSQNVALFAFFPASYVVGVLTLYFPSLGLSAPQVELLQGYLYWVAEFYIVPSALYGGPTGQLLDPTAGGYLVKRSVQDWLYGWKDPLLGLNNSLALAWPSADSAAETFGVPTEELTSSLSALVFEYQLQTGKLVNTTANYVNTFGGQTDVFAYPSTPTPYGTILLGGSAGGLVFPFNVRSSSIFELFDGIFTRPLNVSFTGNSVSTEGIHTWEFSLIDEELIACNETTQQPAERCAYPDVYSGIVNQSLTYFCPTFASRPHFYKAEAALAASTGFNFAPNPAEHDWTFGIEPVSGYALGGSKGYQINHLIKRTSFLYPDVWMNATSSVGGMWVPTFWLREAFRIYPAYVGPSLTVALLVLGIIFMGLSPGAKRVQRESEQICQSMARSTDLTPEEAESVAHLADDEDPDNWKTAKSAILVLEEEYGDFSDNSTGSSSGLTPRENGKGALSSTHNSETHSAKQGGSGSSEGGGTVSFENFPRERLGRLVGHHAHQPREYVTQYEDGEGGG